MIWKPNVTVAAVIERDGKFLLVEEETESGLAFNQPAGHLEAGESLLDAVVRETMEETAYPFRPTALVGIYQWRHPVKDLTYLRFAFSGELQGEALPRALALFAQPEEWRRVQVRGMGRDFGWEASAREYEGVYCGILAGRQRF